MQDGFYANRNEGESLRSYMDKFNINRLRDDSDKDKVLTENMLLFVESKLNTD